MDCTEGERGEMRAHFYVWFDSIGWGLVREFNVPKPPPPTWDFLAPQQPLNPIDTFALQERITYYRDPGYSDKDDVVRYFYKEAR